MTLSETMSCLEDIHFKQATESFNLAKAPERSFFNLSLLSSRESSSQLLWTKVSDIAFVRRSRLIRNLINSGRRFVGNLRARMYRRENINGLRWSKECHE